MVDACLDREDRIGKGGPRCKQFHGWRTEEGFRLTVTSRRLVSQLMQKQGGEREMRKFTGGVQTPRLLLAVEPEGGGQGVFTGWLIQERLWYILIWKRPDCMWRGTRWMVSWAEPATRSAEPEAPSNWALRERTQAGTRRQKWPRTQGM